LQSERQNRNNTAVLRKSVRASGHGADVDLADGLNRRALSITGVSSSSASTKIIKVLLKHGADINTPGGSGYPPLMDAVLWRKDETVKFLLNNRAGLGGRLANGDTILIIAIRVARHGKVMLLLRRGTGLEGVDADGRNVLHHLATNGGEEMMGIFTKAELWRGWDGKVCRGRMCMGLPR